jgi:hypothetical protein
MPFFSTNTYNNNKMSHILFRIKWHKKRVGSILLKSHNNEPIAKIQVNTTKFYALFSPQDRTVYLAAKEPYLLIDR